MIRLAVTRRGFMPAWFLYLSIVIDVAILMALIWSFHLQYGQPPSFYLKAPTILYVFIFHRAQGAAVRPALRLRGRAGGGGRVVGAGGLRRRHRPDHGDDHARLMSST